jgi:outer membrane lipoprotein-sorting protein
MKKKFVALFTGLVLMGFLMLPGLAQTEKDILENMIKALGGRQTLSEIKDTRISGTIEIIQYGMNAPMTIYQKEPNKYRMEMEIMGMSMIQVFDGQKAMMTNPQTGEVMELPPDQTNDMMRQALGNDATLHPEKYGISYTFKGKEEVNGRQCLILEQKFQDGFTSTFYLDANTYLPYKSKSKSLSPTGSEVESEIIFSDYRKVGNTMAAFSMAIYQEGVESIRMTFSEIVYNTGIDDSLFTLK